MEAAFGKFDGFILMLKRPDQLAGDFDPEGREPEGILVLSKAAIHVHAEVDLYRLAQRIEAWCAADDADDLSDRHGVVP